MCIYMFIFMYVLRLYMCYVLYDMIIQHVCLCVSECPIIILHRVPFLRPRLDHTQTEMVITASTNTIPTDDPIAMASNGIKAKKTARSIETLLNKDRI